MAFVDSVAVNWIYQILYAYCFLVVCSIPFSFMHGYYLCHLMFVRIDRSLFEVGYFGIGLDRSSDNSGGTCLASKLRLRDLTYESLMLLCLQF